MDAFAVSLCKGLSTKKINVKNVLICGMYFGVFQGLMPLLGYILAGLFQGLLNGEENIIAFVLLTIIGVNMIKDSKEDHENVDDDFSFKAMLPLAIATSIDALAVGVTFAMLKVNILKSISIIGLITFVLSTIGVLMGHKLGLKYKSKAECAGGAILIVLGLKFLFENFI